MCPESFNPKLFIENKIANRRKYEAKEGTG